MMLTNVGNNKEGSKTQNNDKSNGKWDRANAF